VSHTRPTVAVRSTLSSLPLRIVVGLLVTAALAAPAPVEAAARQARPAPAQARDPEIWITIAAQDLAALDDAFGRAHMAALLTTYESRGGISVALMRESRLGDLAAAVHNRFNRCGGFMAHGSREQALQALDAPRETFPPRTVSYTIDNGPAVQAIMTQTSEPETRATITQLSSYLNRYYTSTTGVQAAQWLKSRWETIAQGRSDVQVQFFNHAQWAQPSVMAIMYGTDFPKEAVVIGGHLDSINTQVPSSQRPTASAPGADDDASGVASLTETFRAAVAAGYRPARTVMFMAYAAEEVGLRGSAEIAQAFLTSKFQVIGAFQLDMTNYKGSAIDIGVLTDASYTNAAQTQFVRDLIVAYMQPLGYSYQNTTCGYGCSDHASWHTRGFVASMAFESVFGQHNQNLHKTTDTLAISGDNANHALKFAKLAAAYMAELAKGTIVTP
jgi:leucyl aminopeptidase